ncbi:hypothetical protein [Methanocorpusculum sp.]|jgi:hypothetical protein|nr:hypothetical protein [Methanocorpusculum sp.]
MMNDSENDGEEGELPTVNGRMEMSIPFFFSEDPKVKVIGIRRGK